MNEDSIAAAQAAKIPQPEPVADTPAPQAPLTDQTIAQPEINSAHDSLTTYKLYDHFDIDLMDRSNPHVSTQISYIWQWASKQVESTEYADIMPVLRRMESSLGLGMREDRLERLYRFIKLDEQRRSIEEQQRDVVGW